MYTIMIVDNDVLERKMIKQALCQSINQIKDIDEDNNSIEALNNLKNNKIDILIIDVSHTSLGIGELIQKIKTINDNALVIFTTVRSENEACHMAMKLNADNYLLKPYPPQKLIAIISRYIQGIDIKLNISANDNTVRKEEKFFAKPVKEQLKRDAKMQHILERIKGFISEHIYKQTLEETKKYIDVVYETFDNRRNILGVKIVELIDEMVNSVGECDSNAQKEITIKINDIKKGFEQYNNKYDTYKKMTELVKCIFERIDANYQYTEYAKKVLNYIDRNIERDLSLNEIASFVNMNACYFSKFFKKEIGVNFITYVTDSRIEMAKEMLRYTDMPIANISCELSYNETNYFSKTFKKKEGMTPSQYREKMASHM